MARNYNFKLKSEMSGNNKPTFVFAKMLNCGHCTQFAESPSPTNSPWAQLVSDPELRQKVNFIRYDWGVEAKMVNGKKEMVRNKLPEQYSFINYGPAFYLHNSDQADKGVEYQSDPKLFPRNFAGIKKWILEQLKSDPTMSKIAPRGTSPAVAQPSPAKIAPRAIPNNKPLAPSKIGMGQTFGKRQPVQLSHQVSAPKAFGPVPSTAEKVLQRRAERAAPVRKTEQGQAKTPSRQNEQNKAPAPQLPAQVETPAPKVAVPVQAPKPVQAPAPEAGTKVLNIKAKDRKPRGARR